MKEYRKTDKHKIYQHNYKKANRPRINELRRKGREIVRPNFRKIVFEFYGNKCSCCGETEPLFLTVDHINNDGYRDKKKGLTGVNLYEKIVRDGFPSS